MPDEYINCPLRHQNGNCLPCGGFCTAVNSEICKALRNAYQSGYYDSTIDSLRDLGPIGGSVMNKRQFITVKDQFGENVFELVNEVPLGYTVWNIGCKSNGGHMTDGYLPLCRLKREQPFEGGREIEPDTLKAIKIEGAAKVMEAFTRGFNTLEKMEFYVKRFRNVQKPAIQRRVEICNAAIPVMKKLNWKGEM